MISKKHRRTQLGDVRKSANIIVTSILLVTCCLSCVEQRAVRTPPPPPPKAQYLEHVVRYSGETLGLIASWYTGNANNWKRILDENSGLRPEAIRIGETIRIPRALIVEERPLPENMVSKGREKRKADTGPKKTAGDEGVGQGESGGVVTEIDLGGLEGSPDASEVVGGTETGVGEVGSPVDNAAEVGAEGAGDSGAGTAPGATVDDEERQRLLDELLGR